MNTLKLVGGGLIALAASSVAAAAVTPAQKCQDAIVVAAQKYFDSVYKAQAKCRDQRAVSGLPADCSTDPKVTGAVTKAETTLTTKLSAKCTGLVASADLGLACKGVTTLTDLVDCITDDVNGPRALELIDVAYDGSGQITDPLLRKCQKTIGKSLRKGAKLRQKARRKCAKSIALVDGAPAPCPDAKTFTAFDKAREKLVFMVEKTCSDTQVLDAALKIGGECSDTAPRRAGRGIPAHDVRAQRLRQLDPPAHAPVALHRGHHRGAGGHRVGGGQRALRPG